MSAVQSKHTDKVTRSGPRVPGDLRFSLAFLVFPWVSFCFPSFSTLAILVSYGFPCFRDSGDLIARPHGRIPTVLLYAHVHTRPSDEIDTGALSKP